MMLTVFCVVVGEGRPFSVKIATDETVDDLKKKIKEEIECQCPAKDLQLYLALKDNQWLSKQDNVFSELLKNEANDMLNSYLSNIQLMDPMFDINDYFGANSPQKKRIHILVVVPKKKQRQEDRDDWKPESSIAFSLQDIQVVDPGKCNENVWIDTSGFMKVTDFPEKYFIRKESIHIFNLLKTSIKQIVLVGSPGVGKSLILVLYSFWMAIEQKKAVLLVRHVKGKGEGVSIIFLNGVDPLKSWKVAKCSVDKMVPFVERYSTDGCLLCLDGFLQSFLKNHIGPLTTFSVLATSAQYLPKQDDAPVLDLCLVPFWSLSDLKHVGKYKNDWDDDSMEKKYYYSGGSLRLFLLTEEEAKIAVEVAFTSVDVTSADLLKTQYGTSSVGQVDCIRMATLNTCDLSNYRNPGEWSYVICSGFALKKLGEYVTLEYYKDLCYKAYTINDFGLLGIAFENFFHAMARKKQEIQLMIRDYDREKKRDHEYSVWKFTSQISLLKGEKQSDFKKIMSTWPDALDYWYPKSRSLKTIDSVAKVRDEFMLLQLTKSKKHSIDTGYLETISNCFPPSNIAYIAVVPNKIICDEFRLIPANPDTQIPLRVAYVNDDFFNQFDNME